MTVSELPPRASFLGRPSENPKGSFSLEARKVGSGAEMGVRQTYTLQEKMGSAIEATRFL